MSTTSLIRIPESSRVEHEAIHEDLVRATKALGTSEGMPAVAVATSVFVSFSFDHARFVVRRDDDQKPVISRSSRAGATANRQTLKFFNDARLDENRLVALLCIS